MIIRLVGKGMAAGCARVCNPKGWLSLSRSAYLLIHNCSHGFATHNGLADRCVHTKIHGFTWWCYDDTRCWMVLECEAQLQTNMCTTHRHHRYSSLRMIIRLVGKGVAAGCPRVCHRQGLIIIISVGLLRHNCSHGFATPQWVGG